MGKWLAVFALITVPLPARAETPPPVALVPALGVAPWGRGAQELACSGACERFAGPKTGYAHAPALAFGAEVLLGVGRYLRVGPSFRVAAGSNVELPGVGSFSVGSDLTTNAVVEGFIPLASQFGIAPRLQAGVLTLTPGGDLQDYLNDLRGAGCVQNGCPITDGSRVGWNAGAGVGGWLRATSHLRFRLDADFQYYAVSLYTMDVSLGSGDIEVSEVLSGARLFLMFRAEVF